MEGFGRPRSEALSRDERHVVSLELRHQEIQKEFEDFRRRGRGKLMGSEGKKGGE